MGCRTPSTSSTTTQATCGYTRVNDDGVVGLNNRQNEVWGSTDPNILQGSPAIAYSSWECFRTPTGLIARMTEGDVIFDYGRTRWTPLGQKNLLFTYTGSARLLQATAIHEFGHAAGLLHENTRYNVMGSDYTHVHTNGGVTNAYMGEDTGTANVFLYGLWAGAPQDLGVSHWRYSGAQGEYSAHARTRLFSDTTGALLPTTLVNGELGFVVRRGQAVRAEFTYENNGRTTVTGGAGQLSRLDRRLHLDRRPAGCDGEPDARPRRRLDPEQGAPDPDEPAGEPQLLARGRRQSERRGCRAEPHQQRHLHPDARGALTKREWLPGPCRSHSQLIP